MPDPARENAVTASEHLLAGFAEIDISPPLGTQIAGDIGRPRLTEEIREPIFARAAVFENEGTKLCVPVLDLLGIGREWAERFRDGAAERFGFDRRAVMVHTTQTHSAPSPGNHFCADDNRIIPPEHAWLRGSTPEYTPTAVEKSFQVIGHAVAAIQPVTLSAARGIETRVSFNRRFVAREGITDTHAHCGRDNVLYTEGPIDPEVGLLQATGENGNPVGMLLHFTSHPAFGYPKRYVSPDSCGYWVNEMIGFAA